MKTPSTTITFLTLLLGAPFSAIAASGYVIEEIIVTAQRVEESASKVPIAINAFDELGIEDRHIVGIDDLRMFVPNFNNTTTNTIGRTTSLRGIGSLGSTGAGEPGVSLHINEIPLPAGFLGALELYDVERIEVLRGPQGTLYGRNATGGVVNIINRQPAFDGVSGYVDAEGGAHDLVRLRGAFNLPIGDALAIRIAGLSHERDGYSKNLAARDMPEVPRDIDGRDLHSLRASMTWQITDRTTATLRYERLDVDDDRTFIHNQICKTSITPAYSCQPGEFGLEAKNPTEFFLNPRSAFSGLAPLGARDAETGLTYVSVRPQITNPRHVHVDHEPTYKVEQDQWQLDLRHAVDWGEFALTGGYLQRHGGLTIATEPVVGPELLPTPQVPDGLYPISAISPGVDGLSGDVCNVDEGQLGLWGGCSFGSFSRYYSYGDGRNDLEYWSVEAKLRSELDGRVNFLIGTNYQSSRRRSLQANIHNTTDYWSRFGYLNPTGLFLRDAAPAFRDVLYTPVLSASESETEFDSFSAFGELYVALSDAVNLTLGVRYNRDEKGIADRSMSLGSAINFNGGSILDGLLGPDPVWVRTELFDPVWGTAISDFYGATEAIAEGLAILSATGNPFPWVEALQSVPIVEQINERRRITGTPTSQTWEAWSGRAAITWQATPTVLVYGSYARGYKPGGFNPGALFGSEAPLTHEREDVDTFEVGAKALLLDSTLSVNAAAFFNDYQKLQIARPRFDILTGGAGNTNVDAETYGAELEVRWRPAFAPRAELEVGYSWLHTKLTSRESWLDPTWRDGGNTDYTAMSDWFVLGSTFVARTEDVLPLVNAAIAAGVAIGPGEAPAAQHPNGIPGWFNRGFLEANGVQTLDGIPWDIRGNRLPETPEHTIHLAASYTWDVAGGALTARWDYYWQDNVFLEIFNHAAFQSGSWDQHNATLTFESSDGRWSVRGWIKNIENDVHITGGKRTTLNAGFGVTEPRAYGASVRWNFGAI